MLSIKNYAVALAVVLQLVACGGSTESQSVPQLLVPQQTRPTPQAQAARAMEMPGDASGSAGTSVRLYQAFYGRAPTANEHLAAITSIATDGGAGLAASLAAGVAGESDAAFARRLMDNLDVTSSNVNAASWNALYEALQVLLGAYGPQARGQITLNCVTILAGLGTDVTFGPAASQFNAQVSANLASAISGTEMPTISLSANALINGTTDLVWATSHASSCNWSGSASGIAATSGRLNTTAPITSQQSFALSCSGPGGSTSQTVNAKLPGTFARMCDPSTAATTFHWIGEFAVSNDFQGIVGNAPQCQSGSVADDGTVSITTQWNFDTSQGYKAAPGLTYGKLPPQPWGNFVGQATTAGFPMLATEISSTLGVTYTNTITGVSAGSAYDLLLDLYFATNRNADAQVLELSINQMCVNACYANYIGTVTIDGTLYNVNYNPPVGRVAQLAFSSMSEAKTTSTVRFKPFVDYAISGGYLPSSSYLADFTVQNEVYSGAATSNLVVKTIR